MSHFTWAVYARRALFSPLRRRFGAASTPLEPLRLRFPEALFLHTMPRGDPFEWLDDISRQLQHADRSRSPHRVDGEAAAATLASGELHAGTSHGSAAASSDLAMERWPAVVGRGLG